MRKLIITTITTFIVILMGISSASALSRRAEDNLAQMRAVILDQVKAGQTQTGTVDRNMRATITVVRSISPTCRMFDEKIERLRRNRKTGQFVVISVQRELRLIACRTGQSQFGLGTWSVQGRQVDARNKKRKPCRYSTSTRTSNRSPDYSGVLTTNGGVGIDSGKLLDILVGQANSNNRTRTSSRCSWSY